MAMEGARPVRTILLVLVCVLAAEALGLLSARITGPSGLNPWYLGLVKPEIQPPGMWFGLAWALLYAMIGAALGLIFATRTTRGKSLAVIFFLVQLGLNLAWSPLFFRAHRMQDAFWLLVAVFIVSLVVTWRFWVIRRLAALLMLPYLAWLVFAGVLNWQIVQLNLDGGPTISFGTEAAIPPR
jgi:translocator protein